MWRIMKWRERLWRVNVLDFCVLCRNGNRFCNISSLHRGKKNHTSLVRHRFATGRSKPLPSPPKEGDLLLATTARELEPGTQQCDTLDKVVTVDASEVGYSK